MTDAPTPLVRVSATRQMQQIVMANGAQSLKRFVELCSSAFISAGHRSRKRVPFSHVEVVDGQGRRFARAELIESGGNYQIVLHQEE